MYNNIVDKERMNELVSEYQAQSKKQDLLKSPDAKELHEFYSEVTPAGVGRYIKRAGKDPIISAATLKETKMEDKIKDVWTVVDI